MSIEQVRDFFLWCSIIDVGLLLFWFVMLSVAHDWVYRWHSRWFKLSVEKFDSIHYAGMAIFKMAVFVFNVVPYVALLIVGGK